MCEKIRTLSRAGGGEVETDETGGRRSAGGCPDRRKAALLHISAGALALFDEQPAGTVAARGKASRFLHPRSCPSAHQEIPCEVSAENQGSHDEAARNQRLLRPNPE
jgi:hypothetical protein